jgi:hypothetical protein
VDSVEPTLTAGAAFDQHHRFMPKTAHVPGRALPIQTCKASARAIMLYALLFKNLINFCAASSGCDVCDAIAKVFNGEAYFFHS